jgi:hypothetical protein
VDFLCTVENNKSHRECHVLIMFATYSVQGDHDFNLLLGIIHEK